jgi:hypothetical protein
LLCRIVEKNPSSLDFCHSPSFCSSLFRFALSSNLIFLDEPQGNMADDYLVAIPGDFFCPAGGSW